MKTKRIAKTLLAVSLIFTSIFCLVGCRKKLTDTPLEGLVKVADFSTGENESFFASNGWCNGEPFNVTWSKKNVKYEDSVAKLFITEKEEENAEIPYYGGELRSKDHYHYGDYEITMKVEPKKGTCTSFFVYTGPSEYDENGNPNPHDEVDIEFLGKDTTHVQFNFFVNGKGGNEYMYDLGFDASEDFHTYGFRWTDSYITWYVDGVPVYRVDETPKKPLPKTPGRMMTNYWCGTKEAELWMGKYDKPLEGEASEYKSISTSATPIVAPEDPGTNSNIKWDEVNALSGLSPVSSDNKHTITPNNSEYRIQYSEVQGGSYNNVKFPLGSKAYGMNYFYAKLTNNTTDKYSTVRIDLYGDATRKTVNNKTVCNVSSTMDGEEVATDLDWGGTTFAEIEPGKTVVVIIYFEGLVTDLQIMLDSSTYQDTKVYAGDITISDIKFAFEGELKLPEGVELPTEDEEVIEWSNINALASLEPISSNEKHTITVDGAKYNVVYSDVAGGGIEGQGYSNVKFEVADQAEGKNYVHLMAKNNGTAQVTLRVDVVGQPSKVITNAPTICNRSATIDGNPGTTDLEWGGSTFTIPAGTEVEIVVYFEGVVSDLQLMFDSSIYDDTTTHSGNVTISDLKFAAKGEVVLPTEPSDTPQEPEGPSQDNPSDSPVVDNTWTDTKVVINGVDKIFAGNVELYTVAYKENQVKVSYENMGGSTYKNINAQINDIVGTYNTFTFVITNNGSATSKVRVDINRNEQVGNTKAINVSATMNGNAVFTNLEWGGSFFEIAAGQTATCVVVFDASLGAKELMFMIDSSWNDSTNRSGSIILKEMAFSGGTANEPEQPGDTPQEPSVPELPTIDNDAIALEFTTDGAYTVNNDITNKITRVIYSGIKDNSYKCICNDFSTLIGEHNIISITVKNNALTSSKLRFDVGYKLENGNVVSTITKASVGNINNEDSTVTVDVAANSTITIVLEFDITIPATNLNIFIDSGWSQTTSSHNGDLYIGNVKFSSKVNSDDTEQPGDTPQEPEEGINWDEIDALEGLTVNTEVYTVTSNAASYKVVYEDITGATYKNVQFVVAEAANGKNYVYLKITNNGTTSVNVRVDALGVATTPSVNQNDKCNVSATMNGEYVWTDLDWGGTAFDNIAAGATVEIEIYFEGIVESLLVYLDTHKGDHVGPFSGDVTISDIKFALDGELNLPEVA